MVEKVDRVIHKPDVKTNNWETEAPSSEIVSKRNFKTLRGGMEGGEELIN